MLQQVLSCGETSAKTDILSRYSNFSKGLKSSISREVRVLFNLVARDLQTITAKNIRFVEKESETDLWTVSQYVLKQKLHSNQLVDIPIRDRWRVDYLSSLLRQLQEAKLLAQVEQVTRLQDLINSLVQ